MPVELTLTWDSKDLEVWKDAKVERALFRVASMAGNDAATAMRVTSARGVRAKKNIKLGQVNRSLVVTRPINKRDLAGLVWRMRVSGKPIPVANYPVAEVKRRVFGAKGRKEFSDGGVRVEINKGSKKLIKSAFIVTLKSGHRGVFERSGKGRLPIHELYTTKVTDVFHDGGFIPEVQARAQGVFTSTFQRLLPHQLSKLNRETKYYSVQL